MSKRLGIVVVVLGVGAVLLGVFGGVGAVTGTGDGGPLADAGLDQTTTEGSTVYLDAGGSTAPEGSIESYEWDIETPAGEHIQPECATCVRTSFVANESGTYAATVTVTDEEGRTDSDTLYVDVEPYEPPEVTVDGPTEVMVGEEGTYTAEATATEEPLTSMLWRHDDRYHADVSLSSKWSVTEQTNVTFEEPGSHEVNATVSDALGYQASDGMTVEVTQAEPFFAVTITDIDDPVMPNDLANLQVTVENVGEAAATQDIRLHQDGSLVDSEELSLEPGEPRTMTFEWQSAGGGFGTHELVARSANDTDRAEADVEVGFSEENISPCPSGNVDCLLEYGELDAELIDFEDGEGELKLELVLDEDEEFEHLEDSIELDPEEHDVKFKTEDGDVIEVQDDGTVVLEGDSDGDGEVIMEIEEGVDGDGPLGASRGTTLEDSVEGPDQEDERGMEEHVEETEGIDFRDGQSGSSGDSEASGDGGFVDGDSDGGDGDSGPDGAWWTDIETPDSGGSGSGSGGGSGGGSSGGSGGAAGAGADGPVIPV